MITALRLLADAFGRARRRAAISSPYLTERVIYAGRRNVLALTRRAVSNGVQVTVYVAPNSEAGQDRSRRSKATYRALANSLGRRQAPA